MIRSYHDGQYSSDTSRTAGMFAYASNGRVKLAPMSEAGKRRLNGIEWETACYPSHRAAVEASDYVDATIGDYAHCEHDGSLTRDSHHNDTSFEIVTIPMTPRAFKLLRPLFEAVSAELERRGARAHNTDCCGVHVHISRVSTGNDEDARLLAAGKVMELTERFEHELGQLSRRQFRGNFWAEPTGYGHAITDGSRAIRRKAKAIQDQQGFGVHDTRRYRVWNFQNKPTIECRAFKGTMKISTMYASVALVNGLWDYAMHHTTPEVHEATLQGIIDWIGDDDLTTYAAWILDRTRAAA